MNEASAIEAALAQATAFTIFSVIFLLLKYTLRQKTQGEGGQKVKTPFPLNDMVVFRSC